jgi:hypothetical protein
VDTSQQRVRPAWHGNEITSNAEPKSLQEKLFPPITEPEPDVVVESHIQDLLLQVGGYNSQQSSPEASIRRV